MSYILQCYREVENKCKPIARNVDSDKELYQGINVDSGKE
jgi:hypothetical protein